MATYNADNDMFHPSHNQQFPDADSYYSQSSVADNSMSNRKKRELDEMKAQDAGWRKIPIKDPISGLKRDIEYYSTNYAPNTRIRCPITGMRTVYRVGTHDEDLFYTVCNSLGYNGQKTPDHMYYESPEQYERHWGAKVSTDEKTRWYKKNLVERMSKL